MPADPAETEILPDQSSDAGMKVIFIAGYGHSGSTVLDSFLHQSPGVEGVGELYRARRHGQHFGRSRQCACGLAVSDCPYWAQVWRQWTQKVSPRDVDEYFDLQDRFERPRRSWPRLIYGNQRPGSDFGRYARLTARLYAAIGDVSGRGAIVDSSKIPIRAYALLKNPDIDLRLVHLVRDCRAVAWSMIKRARRARSDDSESATWESMITCRTAAAWIVANWQCDWVMSKAQSNRAALVRYEDFAGCPAQVGAELARMCELPGFDEIPDLTRTNRPRHTVAGNRLRKSKEITITPDLEWIESMPAGPRQLTWTLSGAMARRYGYSRESSLDG